MSEGFSATRLLTQKWLSWGGTARSSEELHSRMAQSRRRVDVDVSAARAGMQVPSGGPGSLHENNGLRVPSGP